MQEVLKRLTKMFVFLLFICLSFPFFQYPEESFNVSKVGEWRCNSSFHDVAIAGNYAYCVGDYGLDIIDILSPSSPRLAASYPDSSDNRVSYQEVEVANNRAYVTVPNYLYIIDVSSPTAPSFWGSVQLQDYGARLYINGQYAYVGTGYDKTIQIIDISGAVPPTNVITYNTQWPVRNIHVSGDYLYAAADQEGVKILDISVPTSPFQVSEIKNPDYYVNDVFTAGSYAYIAINKGLVIYDISKPQSPTKVGEYFYNIINFERLHVAGSLAFICSHNLQIVDVSNPSNPVLKSDSQYPGDEPAAIQVVDNLAYIADEHRGLRIMDISDPANPNYLGSLENYGKANAITANGNYLYLGKKYGFQILDISNHSTPTHLSFLETVSPIKAVVLKDSYVFAALAAYDCWFQVYNVSNPLSPTLVAEVSLGADFGYIDFILIDGNYAYVDCQTSIKIFDITNPGNPKQTGSLSVTGNSFGINGNYGYLLQTPLPIQSATKLTVLDISSPSAPQVLNTLSLAGDKLFYADSMAIIGNYAYIVSDSEGVLIYDLSNPVSPSLVKHYKISADGFDYIMREGNYAYLVDTYGMDVIDISNPVSPVPMGYHQLYTSTSAMTARSGWIYLQESYYEKLQIFRFQPVKTPPKISVDRDTLYFSGVTTGAVSPSQQVWVEIRGENPPVWYVGTNMPWLHFSAPYYSNSSGQITVSVDTYSLAEGSYTGMLYLMGNYSFFDPKTVTVYLQVYDPSETSVPFGEFATPTDNSVVSSSVPFTGWVLDDIGVEGVKLYLVSGETLTPIGDAVFSAGARPDIENAYPNYPQAYKAGWGYMMLTNFLPNGGNGTYTIRAVATDMEGNSVTLGNKTIHVDNANAIKPFGAIDTPDQGGMAQGDGYINFGWVLTPLPNTIPKDGSTIRVWVDGKSLGNPVYNWYRSDIQELFPGYNNSSGAGGNFTLDTSQFTNGVHTIQWTATDNAGNTDGIGSRYFSIYNAQNQGTSAAAARNYTTTSTMKPLMRNSPVEVDTVTPVRIKKGFAVDGEGEDLYPADNGEIFVEIKELERVEIALVHPEQLAAHTGNIIVEPLYPLPIGASLQAQRGIFSWMPGVGFVGDYYLAFLVKDASGMVKRKRFRIRIRPKY